jgi:hypothetical protein
MHTLRSKPARTWQVPLGHHCKPTCSPAAQPISAIRSGRIIRRVFTASAGRDNHRWLSWLASSGSVPPSFSGSHTETMLEPAAGTTGLQGSTGAATFNHGRASRPRTVAASRQSAAYRLVLESRRSAERPLRRGSKGGKTPAEGRRGSCPLSLSRVIGSRLERNIARMT